MYKKASITALIYSLTLLAVVLVSFATDSLRERTEDNRAYFSPQDFVMPLPTVTPNTPTPSPTPTPTVLEQIDVKEAVITGYTLELTPIGTYFITAYCPYECGYREYSDGSDNYPTGWVTASGAICHRADYSKRLTEPTTCAVDPSLHYINADGYGDLFYIEEFDRVFIAEDTGGAVRGKHLDLFYEEYDDVLTFPTGYYTVYAVNITEYDIKLGDYDGIEYVYTD